MPFDNSQAYRSSYKNVIYSTIHAHFCAFFCVEKITRQSGAWRIPIDSFLVRTIHVMQSKAMREEIITW